MCVEPSACRSNLDPTRRYSYGPVGPPVEVRGETKTGGSVEGKPFSRETDREKGRTGSEKSRHNRDERTRSLVPSTNWVGPVTLESSGPVRLTRSQSLQSKSCKRPLNPFPERKGTVTI